MKTLKPAPVPLRQLTWLPAERKLVGEISSTAGLGRVHPDACDEGLTVINPRTGAEVVFVIDHVQYADEDDDRTEIVWWTLRPAATGHDLTITLFND
jgi:hypothetical protein